MSTFYSMPNDPRIDILHRLRSADGHLDAVIESYESGDSCEYVLQQLGAVEAALRAIGRKLITCQLDYSANLILSDPCAEARVKELMRLCRLYTLFLQEPAITLEESE